MRGVIARLVSTMKYLARLFFASGLEPWVLKPGSEPEDGEDLDILLDMLQHDIEIIEEA
ncbi:MAG: hypothetical protein PVJ38_06090 [Candidatus Bathyarchaeota archaeon]